MLWLSAWKSKPGQSPRQAREGTVFNPSTLSKVQRITDQIRNIPGVIQSNVLSLSAINAKDIEGTPEGMKINRLMRTVPSTVEEMQQLKERVYRYDNFVGLLVSEDSTVTSILSDYLDVDRAGGFNGLMDRVDKILEPERDDNTVFHKAGMPVYVSWLVIYAARMRYVFPLAFVIIGLVHFHGFRTKQGITIPLWNICCSDHRDDIYSSNSNSSQTAKRASPEERKTQDDLRSVFGESERLDLG